MVTLEDLKLPVFSGLDDAKLSKLMPLAAIKRFLPSEAVFMEGNPAEYLHIVKSGLVLLEYKLSENVTATLSQVRPAYVFGWASLLPDENYKTTAIARDESEIIRIPGAQLTELMGKDHVLAYEIFKGMNKILLDRYINRTEQFLKLLAAHPELRGVI